MNHFRTIKLNVESKYLERGSQFISYLVPFSSILDFKKNLKKLRFEHKSSSHICNAYRIFTDTILQEKGSDDGEPSGSAGVPMLNELKRWDLINVGVFVVRYFGGRKLGVSGLIHCYSESVRLCIDKAHTIQWNPTNSFLMSHDYSNLSKIDFLIRKYNGKLLSRDFNLYIDSKFQINEDIVDDFKKDAINQGLIDIPIKKIK
tara:strand:+ start:1954 stop:2562 length:609 start_codon:yes stop_codon:yes gene_type:complete